ncbi:hypothetical protein D1872_268150 [compost metagenome]
MGGGRRIGQGPNERGNKIVVSDAAFHTRKIPRNDQQRLLPVIERGREHGGIEPILLRRFGKPQLIDHILERLVDREGRRGHHYTLLLVEEKFLQLGAHIDRHRKNLQRFAAVIPVAFDPVDGIRVFQLDKEAERFPLGGKVLQ